MTKPNQPVYLTKNTENLSDTHTHSQAIFLTLQFKILGLLFSKLEIKNKRRRERELCKKYI